MADTRLDLFTIGAGKLIPVDHTGPASYTTGGETLGQINNQTGVTLQGLATLDAVLVCGVSISGNYTVQSQPTGSGSRKTFKLIWAYSASAGTGVVSVTGSGGSGMTAGTYALTFGSGSAAGTITVTTSAITNVTITNPGSYTVPPTVSAATGGTPPTLTAVLGGTAGSQIPSATNLSGETVRLVYIGR